MLKQMRLIHKPFSAQEIESYRQFVFSDLMRGLKCLLNAFPDMDLELPSAYTHVYPENDPQDRGGYVQWWAPGECGGMSEIGNGLEGGVKPDMLSVRITSVLSSLRMLTPHSRRT